MKEFVKLTVQGHRLVLESTPLTTRPFVLDFPHSPSRSVNIIAILKEQQALKGSEISLLRPFKKNSENMKTNATNYKLLLFLRMVHKV